MTTNLVVYNLLPEKSTKIFPLPKIFWGPWITVKFQRLWTVVLTKAVIGRWDMRANYSPSSISLFPASIIIIKDPYRSNSKQRKNVLLFIRLARIPAIFREGIREIYLAKGWIISRLAVIKGGQEEFYHLRPNLVPYLSES